MVCDPTLNVICLREIQRSIKYSSKMLLADRIEYYGLEGMFTILDQEIKTPQGGLIIFNGLQDHTASSIKSLEGFKLAWVEEAQTISPYSLELLLPTIREDGSELLFSWNPHNEDDPIEELFVDKDDSLLIHINYTDNPFVSQVLVDEAEEMKKKDPAKYAHVYLGGFRLSVGAIFSDITVRPITEEDIKGCERVQGLDYGFTHDPSAFCINYIDMENRILYLYDGFYKKGMSNADIASEIRDRGAQRFMTTCDSSEPKSTAYIKGKGIKARAAVKGKDSIMSGIDFLQEFTIIINPHLEDTIKEFRNYSWDTDKQTGKPINRPIDDWNHMIDGVRYSCEHLMRRWRSIGGVSKPRGI